MTQTDSLPAAHSAQLDAICRPAGVIPVLAIQRLEDAVPLGRALVEGGLTVLEVTLRTACALEAVRRLKQALPQATVGVGTVLTPEQYRASEQAGADFVVTPGTTEALYRHGVTSTVPLLPGVATLTEMLNGWQRGYRCFKFFPAEASGGVMSLKAFAGPLPEARFCPTGGINLENAGGYLALNNVMCVGGSWLTPKALIDAQDWNGIRQLAKETMQRFSR